MHVFRGARDICVQAPAKVNLFFEVLGRRDDGYHEIETLMCPVDLYDTLYFRVQRRGQIELRCRRVWEPSGAGAGRGDVGFQDHQVGALPEGPDNLAVKAVELLRSHARAKAGATMLLVKRIPIAAGLGGGSSDAAAALVAANLGWNLGRSAGELAALAAQLGSDVPFFLAGGPAICRGRGEWVEPVRGIGAIHFVVARPPAGLSTAAVYGVCQPAGNPRPLAPLVEALRRGNHREAGRLLFNRLQPAAETLSPWIGRLRRAFSAEGFLGHGMSGSGASYFGVCRHARHARHVARRLRGNGVGSVFAVRSSR